MALDETALTTLATAKDELVTADDGSDARLERYIRTASATITAYLNRGPLHFAEGVYETLGGVGLPFLLLRRAPLVLLGSVAVDGVPWLADEQFSVASASAGILVATDDARGWPSGARVEVTYSGGWVTPGQAVSGYLAQTLPEPIEHACLLSVVQLERARGQDPSLASESYGDASVSYAGRNVAIGRAMGGIIPDAALVLLAPYRRPPL